MQFDLNQHFLVLAVIVVTDMAIFWLGWRLALGVDRGVVSDATPPEPADSDYAREPASEPLDALMDRMEERFDRVEKRLAMLESLNCEPTFPVAKESGSLELAARLATRGSDVDELMDLCGLGRGEAELIRNLQLSKLTPSEPATNHSS